MADNYQLFSEIIPTLTQGERAWAERVLGCTQQPDGPDDAAKILKEAGVDMDAVDLDEWPGFQWSIDSPDSELWLYGEEFGNVSHVAEFVRAFLARFRPAACWHLTWAETCSRPRIGEFGGGAVFVTASAVKVFSPTSWIERRRKAFERPARTHRA